MKLLATHTFNCIVLMVKFCWTSCEDIPLALLNSRGCWFITTLCSQFSGCEAAVHSVQTLFDSPETEAVMLVDATNALILLIGRLLCVTFSILVHRFQLS